MAAVAKFVSNAGVQRPATPRIARNTIPSVPDPTPRLSEAPAGLDALRSEIESLRRRERQHREQLKRLERERLEGGAMQRELLPQALPAVDGAEIGALFRPADVISGDLYDVVRLDDEHVALMLIDATGHGIAAALLAAHARRVIRGVSRDALFARLHPGEVLSRLNEELVACGLTECSFVAALYAVLHEPTSTIRWARGGVPYPVLRRRGAKPRAVVSEGPIVGVSDRARFPVVEMKLKPGDTLVFHTDGLENRRAGSSPADVPECVGEWLTSNEDSEIAERIAMLERELREAARVEPAHDDVTLLAVHVGGRPAESALTHPQVALAAS